MVLDGGIKSLEISVSIVCGDLKNDKRLFLEKEF